MNNTEILELIKETQEDKIITYEEILKYKEFSYLLYTDKNIDYENNENIYKNFFDITKSGSFIFNLLKEKNVLILFHGGRNIPIYVLLLIYSKLFERNNIKFILSNDKEYLIKNIKTENYKIGFIKIISEDIEFTDNLSYNLGNLPENIIKENSIKDFNYKTLVLYYSVINRLKLNLGINDINEMYEIKAKYLSIGHEKGRNLKKFILPYISDDRYIKKEEILKYEKYRFQLYNIDYINYEFYNKFEEEKIIDGYKYFFDITEETSFISKLSKLKNIVILAPGDSPSKPILVLSYIYDNLLIRNNIKIISFPLSGVKECNKNLKEYLNKKLKDANIKNIKDFGYVDSIDRGQTKSSIEKCLNIKFKKELIYNLLTWPTYIFSDSEYINSRCEDRLVNGKIEKNENKRNCNFHIIALYWGALNRLRLNMGAETITEFL